MIAPRARSAAGRLRIRRRAAVVSASLVTLALAASPGAYAAARADWPQFHFGAGNTGWNRFETTLTSTNAGGLQERWHVDGSRVGSPIAVGPYVFATRSDQLVASARDDGAIAWTATLPDSPILPPGAIASDDGLVVVAAGGELRAYETNTGTPAWSASVGGTRGPTILRDTVFVGSFDKRISAFDLRTGAVLWNVALPGEVQSIVAGASGRVFVASMDERLSALDAKTGELLWTRTGIGTVYGGGPAVLEGIVYVAGDVGGEGGPPELFAFQAATGKALWRAPCGDDVHAVPAVDAGAVYIGSIDGNVRAFDPRTGAALWTSRVPGEIFSSIASAGGVVYVTTDFGSIVALDASTGTQLWATRPGIELMFATAASPAVAGGSLYVGFGSAGLRAYAAGG